MQSNFDVDELSEDELVEVNCPYKQLGDLWMCQFCHDKCSYAGKEFEDE